MSDHYYWTYWTHRVQELWHDLELLKKRVEDIEEHLGLNTMREKPSQKQQVADQNVQRSPPVQALKEFEFIACMAIKELGGNPTVQEINMHLQKSRNINEDIKTTLMRLKGAIQKGYVAIDPNTKRFSLVKDTFVVE